MAVLVQNINGHLQTHLTRSLERVLEEANQSGELRLSNRKLKDFPKQYEKYNLGDTVVADLSKNRFSELPEEVTTFNFLEKLQCYHNYIRHIPDSVSNLQCLNFLDLSRNQLTSLPRELSQLPIKILLVSNNRLKSLPDELSRMTQLMELDASCNQLTHLPPRMGDLKSLQFLSLRDNLLLAVPIDVTLLPLVKLDIRANRITILPVEIRNMTTLIDLYIEDNPLSSPPASLCRRGRVHIFKYLENEAVKLDGKPGTNYGTLGRCSRKGSGNLSPGPLNAVDRLKARRQNVDSGYSTSSDDKIWSQENGGDLDKQSLISSKSGEMNGNFSTSSSLNVSLVLDDDFKNGFEKSSQKQYNGSHYSPGTDPVNSVNHTDEEKYKLPLNQIQTYREYKEALKQQRAQEVPSIYRTKDVDDNSYRTEPNTPTYSSPVHSHSSLATSKSDPSPLYSALRSPKYIRDDSSVKKFSKIPRNYGNSLSTHNIEETDSNRNGDVKYIKPKSPMKLSSHALHDNLPPHSPNHSKPVSGGLRNSNDFPKNGNEVKSRSITWNKEVSFDKMSFTMRREIDKAREETDLINQLRNLIETRLKMALPEDLGTSLSDGVVLCHLANNIKPRSVASIHVPSPAVPRLTMARCRRNVDNFIEACRKIGVDENMLCCPADVLEGKSLVQIAITVIELVRFHTTRSTLQTKSISTAI